MSVPDKAVRLRLVLTALAGATFNPWQAFQALAQSGGQFLVCLARLLRRERIQTAYGLRLPVEGPWIVLNGGVTEKQSHSWRVVAQRFAYDLAVRADGGGTHVGAGTQLADYPAYGRPVVAPDDGVVVSVVDGIPDHPRPGTGAVDWTARDIRGNHVVIRHAARVYSLCGHLQPGSCLLRPGDAVRRGDMIGRCGNSGHSTEPHLHFHVQDRPSFYLSAGVPAVFARVEAKDPSGAARVAEQEPLRNGEEVRDLGRASSGGAGGVMAPRIGLGDVLFSLWLFIANVVSLCTVWGLIVLLARALLENVGVA